MLTTEVINGTPTGDKIRTAREARGWTQTELAARSGVTAETISRAERGRRVIGDSVRLRLASAFAGSEEREGEPSGLGPWIDWLSPGTHGPTL